MSESIPPFRPRGVIGFVEPDGVRMSPPFMRWIDELRQTVGGTSETPTGTIRTSFSNAEPDGWLKLNGQSVRKDQFGALYSVFGGAFGETPSTFNLPDATNRVLIGAGAISLAQFGGASSVTLTPDNLPAHSHAVTDPGHNHAITDPGHAHTGAEVDTETGTAGTDQDGGVAGSTGTATTGISLSPSTTGITIADTGLGVPFDVVPLSIGVTVLVKT